MAITRRGYQTPLPRHRQGRARTAHTGHGKCAIWPHHLHRPSAAFSTALVAATSSTTHLRRQCHRDRRRSHHPVHHLQKSHIRSNLRPVRPPPHAARCAAVSAAPSDEPTTCAATASTRHCAARRTAAARRRPLVNAAAAGDQTRRPGGRTWRAARIRRLRRGQLRRHLPRLQRRDGRREDAAEDAALFEMPTGRKRMMPRWPASINIISSSSSRRRRRSERAAAGRQPPREAAGDARRPVSFVLEAAAAGGCGTACPHRPLCTEPQAAGKCLGFRRHPRRLQRRRRARRDHDGRARARSAGAVSIFCNHSFGCSAAQPLELHSSSPRSSRSPSTSTATCRRICCGIPRV